jgi:hypothetical protein
VKVSDLSKLILDIQRQYGNLVKVSVIWCQILDRQIAKIMLDLTHYRFTTENVEETTKTG